MHHTARTVLRTPTTFHMIGVMAFATMTKRNKLAKKVIMKFSRAFFLILLIKYFQSIWTYHLYHILVLYKAHSYSDCISGNATYKYLWQAKAACSEDIHCVGVYKRELWQFSLCLGIRVSTKHIDWTSRTYRKPDQSGVLSNKKC